MKVFHAAREIGFRVVYCGPAGAGVRERLAGTYRSLDPATKGSLIEARSGDLATSFFDFVPPGLPPIRGLTPRFHLYAVDAAGPGARPCDLSRFSDVDAVVFVARATPGAAGEVAHALSELRASLDRPDRPWQLVPVVLQLCLDGAGPGAAELGRLLEAEGGPVVEASLADGTGLFATLKEAVGATLVALRDGHLREWSETEEERARGEAFLARARVAGHHGRYLGEAEDELAPDAPPPGCPEFVVMVHGPTADRPCHALGTAGFSVAPQPVAGPDHRLELVAYSNGLDGALAAALAELGRLSVAARPGDAPWRAGSLVDLGDRPTPYRHHLLLPPPEAPGFSRFEDELWSLMVSGRERTDLGLEVLWAVPLPAGLVPASPGLGRELVASAMRGEPGVRTRWESWRAS